MAASIHSLVRGASRVFPALFHLPHRSQITHTGVRVRGLTPVLRAFTRSAPLACEGADTGAGADTGGEAAQALELHSRYKDTPWEYLDSEEYIESYGSRPVWADYRRNHKGGIPPQNTRKTCIRGEKKCGNPCPICRDPNIIIHYKNVNLLQQFISPHTGTVYDPTRTGVCMKQQKLLNKAIETARDHGLIPAQLPFVDYSAEDFSNSHGAVRRTPAPPAYAQGQQWYPWYGDIQPDEWELARVKKIYKPYLK